MHLIWDWNGTLFDDHHIVIDAVNASLAAVDQGLVIDGDGYRDHYRRPVRAFYDVLFDRPITDAEWETINQAFHDRYIDLLAEADTAADAHRAASEALRRSLTQSILSMWTHDLLVPIVERYGLAEMMLAVRGSDESRGEPKADLLRRHLAELALATDREVVLIGDTFDDAISAEAVGIGAVLYDGGSHHRPELEATGVPVADTLLHAIDIAEEIAGLR